MEKQVTTNEILDAINDFSSNVDQKFEKLDNGINKIDSRLGKVESTMVTKDYLDDKLADLRGDLVVLTRKEDVKVRKLIEIMQRRKLLSSDEVKEILSMEPFPQIFI